MKFLIQGERLSGKQVNYYLDDYRVAKFEFEAISIKSKWITLYQEDKGNLKQLKIFIKEQ